MLYDCRNSHLTLERSTPWEPAPVGALPKPFFGYRKNLQWVWYLKETLKNSSGKIYKIFTSAHHQLIMSLMNRTWADQRDVSVIVPVKNTFFVEKYRLMKQRHTDTRGHGGKAGQHLL